MKPNLRSVDLNLLTIFDAIMQTGKLSSAADQLGMTQPAVSNALSRLRLTFDDDLFFRSRHGMVPTPRSHELIEPIRHALSLIEGTLEGNSDFDPDNSSRTFSLAIGDFGETVLLPALLARISHYKGDVKIRSYPELESTSYELVKQGQLDFYFDYKPPKDARLKSCKFTTDELVVIARNNHPKIRGSLSREAFLDARHIILNHRHSGPSLLENILREASPIPRKSVVEINQYVAVPGLVSSSDCIATLPKRMAEHFAQRESIQILPLPYRTKQTTTWLIWHRGMEKDKGHQWMKQILLEAAGTQQSERQLLNRSVK